MKLIMDEYISVRACAGGMLEGCIEEAIILSMQKKMDVELTHNGSKYKIDYSEILSRMIENVRGK